MNEIKNHKRTNLLFARTFKPLSWRQAKALFPGKIVYKTIYPRFHLYTILLERVPVSGFDTEAI
jgi:hypothetical protein